MLSGPRLSIASHQTSPIRVVTANSKPVLCRPSVGLKLHFTTASCQPDAQVLSVILTTLGTSPSYAAGPGPWLIRATT